MGVLCLPRIPSVSPPASLWDANRRSPRCTLVSLLAAHRSLKTGSLCLVQSSVHASAESSCRERIRF